MLAAEIPGLRTVSLRDRDLASSSSVDIDLVHKGLNHDANCVPLSWKRRNVESYLLWPSAIAEAKAIPVADVEAKLAADFAVAIPEAYSAHAVPQVLLDIDGKEVLKSFGLTWSDLLPRMTAAWLPADFALVLNKLGVAG